MWISTDERVLANALDRHGRTLIVVRTGSGKFHALYRHNNERGCVRALTDEAAELIESAPDEYLLLSYLRANNHPDSTFMVANGLADTLGCSRQRLAAARNSLIQRGYIWQLRGSNQYTGPALYRWMSVSRSSSGEKGVS